MLDVLKNLFENNVISEELKAQIEESWQTRVNENREAVTQELREEFSQRYEHDRQVMVEAIDRMVSDQLAPEIAEFIEDRAQLAEAKAKYAVKMKQDAQVMKEFVTRQLASEVMELHEDQQVVFYLHGSSELSFQLDPACLYKTRQFHWLVPLLQTLLI